MSVSLGRVLIAAACLLWLAGCETSSKLSDLGGSASNGTSQQQANAAGTADEVTGTLPQPMPGGPPHATPELLGSDPNDDLSVGKKYFQQGSYGIAEAHFRKAVELHPNDAEAWVCLAAAYDRLKRFDLADRSYAQAIRIAGPTPEILNNQGFSYMLRGDAPRAREKLMAALAKDPTSPYIKNNLHMLDEAVRKRKAVN